MSDIKVVKDEIPKWDPANSAQSLKDIFCYVVEQADISSSWYWRNKKWKARLSQAIRFLAWILAAVGGLLPVIGTLAPSNSIWRVLNNGLWASLLLGFAAAMIGLDRAFGYSSGWARYVLTATNIRKSLEEFRMDWADLLAKAGTSPTPDQIEALIERARKFRVDVEALVLQETKDWITEFQSSMAQMEKDVSLQLTSLKSQVDKAIQAKDIASQPGSIELTIVDNANKASRDSIKVTVIDSKNDAGTTQSTGLNWTSPFMPPGLYQVKVEATVNNEHFSKTAQVTVKPAECASIQIPIS